MSEDIKNNILSQLNNRNKECQKFAEIVLSHAALYNSVVALTTENHTLSDQCTVLKQQNLDLQVKVESSENFSGGVKSEKYAALEQKLYRTQEELTELHRKKGANAQQVINLNLALQEMEKERNKWEQESLARSKQIESHTESLAKLEQTVQDFKQANQTLNDEYQALHMAYESIEEKLRESQADNAALIERSIKWQEEQAERELKQREEEKKREENDIYNQPLKDPTTSPPPKQPIKKLLDFFSGGPKKSTSNFSIPETHHHTLARTSSILVELPQRSKVKWLAHNGEVSTVRYSPSGDILATGGADRIVKIWNLTADTSSELFSLRGCNGGINNIDYDPTEQILVTCSNDYATRLWTLATQRERLTLTGHSGKVLSVRYLNYSNKIVTGSQDRTVKLWDVKSGSCVKTYMPGSSCNDVVTADVSGECIATGHFDKKIRFYDTRSSSSQSMYEIEVSGRITSLDMPQEKDVLICCTKNHQLNLIDMKNRTVLKVFRDDNFRVSTDYSRCSFSPDGQFVAAGSNDGSVLSWNVKTGDLESNLQVHQDPVISCSWNGELVTGDKHGNCVIWTEY